MLKSAFAAIPLALLAHSASADSTGGAGALALAGLVAPHQPTSTLSTSRKIVIKKLFAGLTPPYTGTITVLADKIECRQSNVSIHKRSCALTFGSHTVNLAGRQAHELFATLVEAGVAGGGAAGSIFETLTALTCTIDPHEIKLQTGGGASCNFTPGP